MAEKFYEKADAYIFNYPDDTKIIFAESNLDRREIFRGPAKKWREFKEDDFQNFAQINGILPETNIAVATGGLNIFAVIVV